MFQQLCERLQAAGGCADADDGKIVRGPAFRIFGRLGFGLGWVAWVFALGGGRSATNWLVAFLSGRTLTGRAACRKLLAILRFHTTPQVPRGNKVCNDGRCESRNRPA